MIRDRNIDWLRTVYRIPYNLFGFEPTTSHSHNSPPGYSTGTFTTTSTSVESIVGMDDGAPQIAEVSTFGVGGIEIAAAGDSMSHLDLWTPPRMDVTKEIGVRVLWTTNGAVSTTDSVTWAVTYDQADVGEALAAASTALDTTIAAALPTATTLLLRRTSRGVINANKFDYTARQGSLLWNVEADALSGFSANEVVFLALEIDYVPLVCANAEEDINVFADLAVND